MKLTDIDFEAGHRVVHRHYPDVAGSVLSVHGGYVCVEWDEFGSKTHEASDLKLTFQERLESEQ